MEYITRTVESYVAGRLGKGRAIVIYGPRQAGKTTLARRILTQYKPQDIIQFQTDDPAQAALFRPEVSVLRRIVAGKKVLFIDEAQSINNAGLVLKLLVDTFPDVQVIATGSSSFELSDKIKESMVGRVDEVTLLPLGAAELAGDAKGQLTFDLKRAMAYGMYPAVALAREDEARDLLRGITESYLYKDVLALADVRNEAVLRRLLTALALQVGQEVSYNELAMMLEVNRATVERYLYLLEQCFVIFRLDPLSSNPRKLLSSRKRKVYFYDVGIRNVLAGQTDIPLEANPALGGMFENFCIVERLKARLNHRLAGNSYYWRSPDSEVDYLEQAGGKVRAYEIKWSKRKLAAPPRFRSQFPEAGFLSVNKDNFWELLEAS